MFLLDKFLRKLGLAGSDRQLSPSEAEALRTAFQIRYFNFRLLLSANSKLLQIMSEMEEALKGNTPFGMSFIRAHCTAASVNVLRMVNSMDLLAPGKYADLHNSFKSIQGRIAEILSNKKEIAPGPLIISFRDLDKSKSDQAGNKMASLGEIRNRLGIKVPNGFVISAGTFKEFLISSDLQVEIDRLMQSCPTGEMDQLFSLSANIQQKIIRAKLPAELEKAILDAYAELEKSEGRGVRVSLRSSALGEDSAKTSFAGLYRSELNVSSEDLLHAYKEVVASKYSLQAITYRLNRGVRDEEVDMCVGCMSMVNAVAGGVVYSKNPVDPRDERIFIHSVNGLPKGVVDGSVAADLFVVSREPLQIVEKEIAQKRVKFVCYDDEGISRNEITGAEGCAVSIGDRIALELARIVLRIEDHYGVAQDVEWALDGQGEIVIVQSRPLRQSSTAEGQSPGGLPFDISFQGRPDGLPLLSHSIKAGHREFEIQGRETIASGGITGSPGAGCGPVFIVQKRSELLVFPKGAVLVVRQALPSYAALLGRASALISEQGTAAGHLASVAREFCVPALLGLEGATNVLQNGRLVTVDADARKIYDGKIEPLLESSKTCETLMEGSPVMDILNRVSENIIPLHLLDPEGPDFNPAGCRTFHDITRFCHEKSVKEMFSFGKDHHFSARASKQLVCDVPMKWWVLNLDDGFREDAAGKFVHLENIASIPMIALWEGIVAVPWEGPPPVDPGGFMSILMEAGSNPALDPSMPSLYASRNYFMISKNFCSLSSRFGFHLSSIEALVGERATENYITFGFKGGAADHGRRVRRAVFIGAILEEFEFRCRIKDDGVTARIEGYGEEVMKEKLRILGYLLMHTRQLDMIMFNDASSQRLRDKLLRDINSVILSRKEAP
jgi:pyruvate,water dikinase